MRGLGLVDWHMLRIVALGNLGTAEAWTGERLEAEHLRAAIETERWGRTLLPHLNAKAHLALLYYERGDLESAEADGLAALDQATSLGWTRTPQAVAAHLALAGVHLDRGRPRGRRRVARVGGGHRGRFTGGARAACRPPACWQHAAPRRVSWTMP